MKKVSFDFDYTLSKYQIYKYALELKERGYDIYITTSRYHEDIYRTFHDNQFTSFNLNKDLYNIADSLNIPKDNIRFTNMKDKYLYFIDPEYALHGPDFIFHLDDDNYELDRINRFTKVKGISCYNTNSWKNKCEKLLKEFL